MFLFDVPPMSIITDGRGIYLVYEFVKGVRGHYINVIELDLYSGHLKLVCDPEKIYNYSSEYYAKIIKNGWRNPFIPCKSELPCDIFSMFEIDPFLIPLMVFKWVKKDIHNFLSPSLFNEGVYEKIQTFLRK